MGLTNKQKAVMKEYKEKKPRVLILHGAKRSGKTFTNNLLFLAHISKFYGENKDFILGGASTNSIFRNVVNDLEKLLGVELKQAKKGYIRVFGNKVHILGGEKKGSYKKARGFTSYGTYLNEMTTLEKEFVQECFTRTSGIGARIFCDTNPDSPLHYVKTDYIDKSGTKRSDGTLDTLAISWTLYDNTSLDEDYIRSTELLTPSGTSYDRNINGLWVSADGIVYKDFDVAENITETIDEPIIKRVLGIDWGYEHFGAIVLIGVGESGTYYLIEYIAKQHEYYEYWALEIEKYIREYKINYIYVDGARPEYFSQTRKLATNILGTRNIRVSNANKSVQEGIDFVGSLMKQRKFKILRSAFKGRLIEELSQYVYGENGEPKKEYDDVLDALRYALFSYKVSQDKKVSTKAIFGKGLRN